MKGGEEEGKRHSAAFCPPRRLMLHPQPSITLLFESRKRGAAKTLRIQVNTRKRRIHAEAPPSHLHPPPPLFISLPSSRRRLHGAVYYTRTSIFQILLFKKQMLFFGCCCFFWGGGGGVGGGAPQCAPGRHSGIVSHQKTPPVPPAICGADATPPPAPHCGVRALALSEVLMRLKKRPHRRGADTHPGAQRPWPKSRSASQSHQREVTHGVPAFHLPFPPRESDIYPLDRVRSSCTTCHVRSFAAPEPQRCDYQRVERQEAARALTCGCGRCTAVSLRGKCQRWSAKPLQPPSVSAWDAAKALRVGSVLLSASSTRRRKRRRKRREGEEEGGEGRGGGQCSSSSKMADSSNVSSRF